MSTIVSESATLIRIENLVHTLALCYLSDQDLVTELVKVIPLFKLSYRESYFYSPLIQDFIKVCNLIDVLCSEMQSGDLCYVISNNLVEIRSALTRNYHSSRQEIKNYRLQEVENTESLRQYLTNLFNHYARLLVVRVDLKYRKSTQEYVSLELFSQHMEILRNRIANKDGCFQGLEGYAWALEQGGELGGYHCHLLLLYQGVDHQQGFKLGQMVEAKWQEITQKIGRAFIVNDARYLQRFVASNTVGVGMVYRDNPDSVNCAIETGLYLTSTEKYGQYLRAKLSERQKTFGMGQYVNSYRRGLNLNNHPKK